MISLLAAASLVLTRQSITVTVNAKAGESIAGIRHFRVNVASDNPITQVEFYVGSELRDSDSSIPYDFDLDTVEEKDGPLELTFAAYSRRGDSQKQVVRVDIDNKVAEGAGAHVKMGADFLRNSDFDNAILQGRIALKIAADNNEAREMISRAYLGKGMLDKAQKYAEDWHTAQPNDTSASDLLSTIDLHRAFSTLSRGGSRDDTFNSINEAFRRAITTRQTILQERLDKLTPPSSDNLIEYADTAIAARRYSLAITALMPEYRAHVSRNEITNRLAYAQLQAGRKEDALNTLTQVKRLSKLDAYGNGMMAMIAALSQDYKAAQQYIDAGGEIDSSNLGLRTAEAFIALRSRNASDLSKVATALYNDAGERPEVTYYMQALATLTGTFEDSRKYFEATVYADPLAEAGYIEEGNNALLFAVKGSQSEQQFRAKSAKAMFETALLVRPESYRALIGMSLGALLMGDKQTGLRYARAAVKTAPTQPAALYALSAALNANDDARSAYDADRLAWKYDKGTLDGYPVPTPMEAWAYYDQYDRIPVMVAPR